MIRVLVVDDSRAFRAILRAILARAPEVEVVAEAGDGDEALAQVLLHRPDVVTMDVRMPGKGGLDAIAEIMARAPTPIVVVSAEAGAHAQEISFWALEAGAIEVLAKPRADVPGRFEREAEAIRVAVRAVAGLKLVTRHRRSPRLPPAGGVPGGGAHAAGSPRRALGIAASTGGPAALARILRGLPPGYPVPVLVVQHIAAGFTPGLIHWLASETHVAVKLAEDREPLRPGVVYVAPEDRHLEVAGGAVRLSAAPAVRGFRPSGTVLLAALAREYGASAAGLVLSGMGDDGADGLRAMRDRGAWTAAQGPQSSVVFGMPRVAIERGGAEHVLELEELATALLRLAGLQGGAAGPAAR